VKTNLDSLINGHVQKIYACPFFYSFKVRIPGKTAYLFIGKGRYSQNVFISNSRTESKYRRKDSFLEKLKKEFLGSKIIRFKDELGFFLIFFNKSGLDKTFLFTFRENLLYCGLVLPYKVNQIESYLIYLKKPYERILKEEFNFSNFLKSQNKILPILNTFKESDENVDPHLLAKRFETKIINKLDKKRSQKAQRIRGDISRLERFLELKMPLSQHKPVGHLVKNETFIFEGIKLKKVPKDYYKLRDLLFKKIKNIEKAIDIQKNRLQDLNSDSSEEAADISTYIFPVSKKIDMFNKPELVKKRGTSLGKYGIYVLGKSSKENDLLRSTWAGANDYWFHFKNLPGPHLFLKLNPGIVILPEVLELVCQAFRNNSETKMLEVDIIYTQVKYLKKVSGSQGKVIPKNERSYRSVG
tara:strand:- start:1077 stop:2315 length:1239 start_codon:yes stop_codon:yes gene_type:complete